MTYQEDLERWQVKYPELYKQFAEITDYSDLGKLKRQLIKENDNGANHPEGVIMGLYEWRRDEFKAMVTVTRSAEEARADRILSIRNSDGKATARRFN